MLDDSTLHLAGACLVVTLQDDGALLVDAEALMRSAHQVRYRQLDPGGDGILTHSQSGTAGPLAEVLDAITHACAPSPEGGER